MNLKRGVNLGGFLSQCEHNEEHYKCFILEEDIKRISEWGLDHVRLPIDCEVVETEDGSIKPSGYVYIDNVVNWCKKYGLNVILDLHKAYGYDFNDAGDLEKNNLFSSEYLKERFVKLWDTISSRYAGYDNVAFELLNEVVETENAELWNQLIKRTVSAIRKNAPVAPIVYGGIQWNSAGTLKYLDIPEDNNIIFTFHFYEPLVFTHQKAYWVKNMDMVNDVPYPETMEFYREKSKPLGNQGQAAVVAKSEHMGPEFLSEMVSEAVRAADIAGVEIYCGEYGVIDRAPIQDTLRWFKDVDDVFRKYDIGCAVWNYKEKDYGIVGPHYDEIRDELLGIWTK